MKKKSEVKSLYLESELIEKIEKEAKRQNRRWSEMVRIMIEYYINGK